MDNSSSLTNGTCVNAVELLKLSEIQPSKRNGEEEHSKNLSVESKAIFQYPATENKVEVDHRDRREVEISSWNNCVEEINSYADLCTGVSTEDASIDDVVTCLDSNTNTDNFAETAGQSNLFVGIYNACLENYNGADSSLKGILRTSEDLHQYEDDVNSTSSSNKGLEENTVTLFQEFHSNVVFSEFYSGEALDGSGGYKEINKIVNHSASQELEKQNSLVSELKIVIEGLKSEKLKLEEEASHKQCKSQTDQLQREIELLKQEHELDIRAQAALKLEIETIKKRYEKANKEKEASVMRYAVSEMEVINQRKERDNVDRKYKEVLKEKDGLTTKLKSVMIEKARISQQLDNKCSEYTNSQKEIEKLKEELNSRDIKIKWTQNKLKSEMESHKESELQVEKLSAMINEAKEEVERSKRDAEASIKQFQCSQQNRAFVLEQQLKEQQAQLILERHSLEDKENIVKQLSHEVETLRSKQLLLIDENNALKLNVASLEKERQEGGETVGRLTEALQRRTEEVGGLQEVTSEMESLRQQLAREKELLGDLRTEASELRLANEELRQEMAGCREREADMLEFTQKVTAKNVRLQNEYTCVEAKARQLECEEEPLQRRIQELQKKIETLEKDLTKEKSDREDEKRLVARHLADKTAKVEILTKKLEDLQGENQVMKHKHSATLRELTREVAQYRKRLEQLECSSGSDSICQGSRASSCGSLDAKETQVPPPATILPASHPEPNNQALIDRVLRSQRDIVRLREKVDFLEEHSKQLTAELQKKTRVLQSYILREEAGTLTPGSMDLNKAELARHGGIMASVYGSKPADDTMTLDLSLEINRKLQAVLEDTLLKNITLKENIDTLGDEIRRISQKT